ncbi:hypothetical protein AGMMS49940_14000 [Spirochaetia bacterium]|nr:hypothetical protein AGMMS49940_14000 [Spirochaetia bacterium]
MAKHWNKPLKACQNDPWKGNRIAGLSRRTAQLGQRTTGDFITVGQVGISNLARLFKKNTKYTNFYSETP